METNALPTEFADRLELFFGAASQAMCRVYARFEAPPRPDNLELTGTLSGPQCAYAQTLPSASTFVDRGPGPSLLAEAVIPEPSFWTPDMPHLYQAELQLRAAGQVLARATRPFGIRPLAASGRKLVYAAKSWVLRGIVADELPNADLPDWHDAQTAMCTRNPDDGLCEAASRIGVLLVAELGANEIGQIGRLQRWPAVGIIALDAQAALPARPSPANAILAQRGQAGESHSIAPWAQAVICEVANADAPPAPLAAASLPAIAIRPAGRLESVAAGRAGCDSLQRDLAPLGQFAGYIV